MILFLEIWEVQAYHMKGSPFMCVIENLNGCYSVDEIMLEKSESDSVSEGDDVYKMNDDLDR
jgi:hypothetical protein